MSKRTNSSKEEKGCLSNTPEHNNTEQTIQGAGFKNKEKALETIRLLEDRDITYQFNFINSMYNRAKVVLKSTTDHEKVNNITEAIDVFQSWIDDYKSHSRSKENFGYLPLATVKGYEKLAKYYRIWDYEFFNAYEEVGGDLKKLRGKKIIIFLRVLRTYVSIRLC